MKIGILTFQGSTNYGAILQAYALNKKLNLLGADCETINYYCDKIENSNLAKIKKPKDIIKNMYQRRKISKYKKFVQKELKMSKSYNRNTIKNSNYDCYIVGSDQVWNPGCSNNDKSFFLDFLGDNKKRYSYAASIGLNNETALQVINENKKEMQKFDTISLREPINNVKLEKIIDKDIRYDVDPVFLLDSEHWKELCSKRFLSGNYIFLYLIAEPNEIIKFAEKLAKEKGYKIISNKKSIEFMMHCSPNDFLSWIYNAKYVVTNSFHATAFSLIFNKKFFVECEGTKNYYNNRVKNVLDLFERADRIIDGKGIKDFEEEIDYEITNEKISNEREKSISYLNSIIHKHE